MIEKILQYQIEGLYNETLLLSTIKLAPNKYETALLFSDGEELELEQFDNILDAVDFNQALMMKCFDMVRTSSHIKKDVLLENVAKRIYYNPMVLND